MISLDDTLIVMPAHNEAESLPALLSELSHQGFAVLLVDDVSTDETRSIAHQQGVKVLKMPFQQGAWLATQAGIRYALKRGYKQVITMDADGQHLPDQLARLMNHMLDSDIDVVVGACTKRGNTRRQLAWQFFRKLTGLTLEDLTSGFRLYNLKAMQVLASPQASLLNYQDVALLLLLRQNQCEMQEICVEMESREHGHSRIFHNWTSVFYYLSYTLILSVSKWGFTRNNDLR